MKGTTTPYPDPYRRTGRGDTYYFTYVDERTGKRRERSTRTSKKGEAVEEIKRFIDKMRSAGAPELKLSFRDYATPFFLDGTCPRQARLHDERRPFGENYMHDLRSCLERVIGRPANDRQAACKPHPFADILLGQITRSDIYALRRELSRDPGGRVGQVIFTAVRTVLSEAVEQGHLSESPAAGIGVYRRPEAGSGEEGAQKERGAFTLEELRALWRNRWTLTPHNGPGWGKQHNGAAPDYRHAIALSLLMNMGMRAGELRALRWEHVDLEKRTIDVVEAMKGRYASSPIGKPKWGKLRPGLAIPDTLHADLVLYRESMEARSAAYVKPSSFVICNPDGASVGQTFLAKLWQGVTARFSEIGIDPGDRWLTPHSLRHSLNTWLLVNGAPPLQVQTYLGWESSAGKALAQMQQHYGHFELAGTKKVAEAVAALLEPAETENVIAFPGGS